VKNLRKRQKIILLTAFTIVFYLLIHPEWGTWDESYGRYDHMGEHWLWEETYGWLIIYSIMMLKVIITCLGTGIALFIEHLIYSNKEED